MEEKFEKNWIVGFVADLMFQVKIEEAARQHGYEMYWVESAEQVGLPVLTGSDRVLGEPLEGAGGALMELLTRLHPVLLIFDLGNSLIPWREWIAVIKSVPATRRLPVLCYGPHVEGQDLVTARSLGAEAAMARSRFASNLPAQLLKWAVQRDNAALEQACSQPLSPHAIEGIHLFNQGKYFEAHEALELAWNEDDSPGRELYRATLQVAVAYLQIERGNYRGAAKMFLRLRQWIDPLPEVCRGVLIGQLRQDARHVHNALLALGPERIAEVDRRLFHPLSYKEVS